MASMMDRMCTVLVWGMLMLSACRCEEGATNDTTPQVVCTPKGLLKLDKPYPAPGIHKGRLPFCSKYGCGCCGQRNVRVIGKAVTEGWSDDGLPDTCRAVLEDMYCGVCDPLVGTDAQPVCADTCKLWWAACKNAFFAVDGAGNLMPCGSDDSSRLICSQLKSITADPEQLCSLAGYTVSSSPTTDCFSGKPSTPAEHCSSDFADPDAHIFEATKDDDEEKSTLAVILESISDSRMVLRGIMLIAFVTFLVKRVTVRHGQHMQMMQQMELHRQRMRLQNQQRAAAAAAAIARQQAAGVEAAGGEVADDGQAAAAAAAAIARQQEAGGETPATVDPAVKKDQ